ncbi:hypothetical protein B484DRAFT_339160 [Ochromonadaceae sp. CCMP2298]|nr:hypothetical protein B484DRAFT_339160 [Ochromonadaceae sp. CCMP2298]
MDLRVGAYTKFERRAKIDAFREKKRTRIWRKHIKYDCRKRLADTRPRCITQNPCALLLVSAYHICICKSACICITCMCITFILITFLCIASVLLVSV